MRTTTLRQLQQRRLYCLLHCNLRYYSRVSPPRPAHAEPVLRVINNVAQLGSPKEGPKPRQLLSLPPFPYHPLPGRCLTKCPNKHESSRVTAISWVKYYLDEVHNSVIQSHFTKGLVKMDYRSNDSSSLDMKSMKKIEPHEVMKAGARIWIPVSVVESRISRRFDTIPSGTLYPNADEIKYMQRLVRYKDSAMLVLDKPPKLPVKVGGTQVPGTGSLSVHNSMDALAAAALSYGYDEGPKLVHRLDRESSGLLLMGRTKESIAYLHQLFRDVKSAKSQCKAWNEACEATTMRYWALVIGSPKEKEGVISAPLTKVLLDDGKTERVILARTSSFEAAQEAITEYRVLGPMINGCSWIELRPHTSWKHQLRVHCAEALGTPIMGDYKYGWFVHQRWKRMPLVNIEPTSGKPYKLRRPDVLDIQKGSVMSKVPLLHLHHRELILPNIAKFLEIFAPKAADHRLPPKLSEKPNVLRFVAPMPSHMKISWNLMSSYLI